MFIKYSYVSLRKLYTIFLQKNLSRFCTLDFIPTDVVVGFHNNYSRTISYSNNTLKLYMNDNDYKAMTSWVLFVMSIYVNYDIQVIYIK